MRSQRAAASRGRGRRTVSRTHTLPTIFTSTEVAEPRSDAGAGTSRHEFCLNCMYTRQITCNTTSIGLLLTESRGDGQGCAHVFLTYIRHRYPEGPRIK